MSVPPSDAAAPPPPAGAPSNEAKQWAFFAHLSALTGFIIPFGSLLGPLIIWQMKKNEMPFVDDQGKEALNFQITMAIAMAVCAFLWFLIIPPMLIPLLWVVDVVFVIMGTMRASKGEPYTYPFAIRLLK